MHGSKVIVIVKHKITDEGSTVFDPFTGDLTTTPIAGAHLGCTSKYTFDPIRLAKDSRNSDEVIEIAKRDRNSITAGDKNLSGQVALPILNSVINSVL